VPLLREDHLLGALAVNRSSPGEFAPEVIDLLKTFATQSALAIQNARLFREIEIKSQQLEIASRTRASFSPTCRTSCAHRSMPSSASRKSSPSGCSARSMQNRPNTLNDILESGRHLLSLINDILDLSKIEAGRMELERTDFDLTAAIENALTLVRERAQRHGITLGRMVDERLGMIRADERKVKQVLLNLLSNALKFTPAGGTVNVRPMSLTVRRGF
jgi:signal transduction histidine kinase